MNVKGLFVAVALLISISVGRTVAQDSRGTTQKDTAQYSLRNCLNEFSMDKIEKTEAGYQYWFVDRTLADGKTLKMSVVKPHEATHAPHSHPEDEFFFVLEGNAEFFLNGRTKVAGPYTSFFCPSNSLHGIRNVGNTTLKYLVIKKYEKS